MKNVRKRMVNGEMKDKSTKVRMTNTEYVEFTEASKALNLDKSYIVREAVKEYLADRGINIWE